MLQTLSSNQLSNRRTITLYKISTVHFRNFGWATMHKTIEEETRGKWKNIIRKYCFEILVKFLRPVVRSQDSAIHRINPYPVDKIYTNSMQWITFIRWITLSRLRTTGPCSVCNERKYNYANHHNSKLYCTTQIIINRHVIVAFAVTFFKCLQQYSINSPQQHILAALGNWQTFYNRVLTLNPWNK